MALKSETESRAAAQDDNKGCTRFVLTVSEPSQHRTWQQLQRGSALQLFSAPHPDG